MDNEGNAVEKERKRKKPIYKHIKTLREKQTLLGFPEHQKANQTQQKVSRPWSRDRAVADSRLQTVVSHATRKHHRKPRHIFEHPTLYSLSRTSCHCVLPPPPTYPLLNCAHVSPLQRQHPPLWSLTVTLVLPHPHPTLLREGRYGDTFVAQCFLSMQYASFGKHTASAKCLKPHTHPAPTSSRARTATPHGSPPRDAVPRCDFTTYQPQATIFFRSDSSVYGFGVSLTSLQVGRAEDVSCLHLTRVVVSCNPPPLQLPSTPPLLTEGLSLVAPHLYQHGLKKILHDSLNTIPPSDCSSKQTLNFLLQ